MPNLPRIFYVSAIIGGCCIVSALAGCASNSTAPDIIVAIICGTIIVAWDSIQDEEL